jgi:hypothetical protein
MTALPIALFLTLQAAATPASPQRAADAKPYVTPKAAAPHTPPQVTFANGTLTIEAADCGLNDVLRAVSKQTRVPIEGRLDGDERVAAKIGPAPMRDVLLTLLQGSHYSFVLMSNDGSPQTVAKIVLMSRLSESSPGPASAAPPEEVPIGTMTTPDSDPDDLDDDSAKPRSPLPQPGVKPAEIPAPKKITTTPVQPAPGNAQPVPAPVIVPGPPK